MTANVVMSDTFGEFKDKTNEVLVMTDSGMSNYIKILESINSKFQCKFFIAAGFNDENLISQVINSSVGKNTISFSGMTIA